MENVPLENLPLENLQRVPAYDYAASVEQVDPDNPRWNVFGGIGTWIGSVVLLFLISLIALAIMYVVHPLPAVPDTTDYEAGKAAITKWGMSPPVVLVVHVGGTFIAHLLTIALCWAVATKFGKYSFREAIGWEWNASKFVKVGVVVGVVLGAVLLLQFLPKFIPETTETPFQEILKSSAAVRYAMAVMAVLTAPLTEELVYRGLLYSPLKPAVGIVGAVTIPTLLFAIVHVPQYWGAWASLTGLLLLSLALTITRAKTKSIYPCVAIHTLFNLIGAIGIVWSGGKTE